MLEKQQLVLDALDWEENVDAEAGLVAGIRYYCSIVYQDTEDDKKRWQRDWASLRDMASKLPLPPKITVGRKKNEAGQYFDNTPSITKAFDNLCMALFEINPNLCMDGSGNEYAVLPPLEKSAKMQKSLRTQVINAWKADKFTVPENGSQGVSEEE